MEHLRGPLYLDVAAKGLCLAGVLVMVFGHGGWFTAGLFLVFIGVMIGAWAMVAARRVRSPTGPARPAPFGSWRRTGGSSDEDSDS
jgi:energy-coupling factor transporter transmembrane protein EcfT